MAAKVKPKNETAEQFVGSVFKFSISTILTFGIYGLAIILENFLVPDANIYGEIKQFIDLTNTIMTIAILGLDQSFIRFFNEPPGKLSGRGLFRLCFYLSSTALVVGGLVCSLFLPGPLYSMLNFNLLSQQVIPFLFINAFFWMVARYFYTLYRMEQSILLYTVTSVLMNFFYKLFYLLGAFFENQLIAMAICSMGGLGIFALFCLFMRRKALVPKRSDLDKTALKTIMPYGLAVAPTAIMVVLNGVFASIYVAGQMDGIARGLYKFGNSLSNIVSAVQIGFASFWGAYMYANYKTQQPRIKKVHDYLNFLILVFFALLVGFEDLLFLILAAYKDVQPILPMMMLSAVFTILCETTVYGITIARKPIFDTIGIGLSLALNIICCIFLIPNFGLLGAAYALAVANFGMYLFRTLIAQHFYSTIRYPIKTVVAVALAVMVAIAGTIFANDFWPKLIWCLATVLVYCLMYRAELLRFVRLGISILKNLFIRRKA